MKNTVYDLIMNGISPTSVAISRENANRKHDVFDNILELDSINMDTLLSIKKLVSMLFEDSQKRNADSYSNIYIASKKITDEMQALETLAADTMVAVKASMVADTVMAGHVNTHRIDFGSAGEINKEQTNAKIIDGWVYGVVDHNEDSDKTRIDYTPVPFSLVKASIYGLKTLDAASIEIFKNDKYTVPLPTDNIVCGNNPIRIYGIGDSSGEKIIELFIDRSTTSEFNQIEISSTQPQLVTVYISDDNIEYKSIGDQFTYVKNGTLPVGSCKARYVKLSFKKNKHNSYNHGDYKYVIELNHVNITKKTYHGVAIVETNPIQLNTPASVIGIDSCCTYSNPNVFMQYKLSVNGGPWKIVRPIGKVGYPDANKYTPSIISINEESDNKIIHLTQKVGNTYTADIPFNFIRSNTIRVFDKNKSSQWSTDGDWYYCYAIMDKEVEVDFGQINLIIDGRYVSGKHIFSIGVHSIKVPKENYMEIYNSSKLKLVKAEKEVVTLSDTDGKIYTVIDHMYPNNIKTIIESVSAAIVQEELIENKDYRLYNNGESFNVETTTERDSLYMLYKLRLSNVDTVKLRIEMQSLDKTTIPNIGRVIIKTA